MLNTSRLSADTLPGLARGKALVGLLALLLLPATLLPGMQALLAAEPAADTAADTSSDTGTADDSGEDDNSTASSDSADASGGGSLDGEGFVPSVQISEDLSVSFPTDI